jgi:CBS domain containing-hemolysin-like protein
MLADPLLIAVAFGLVLLNAAFTAAEFSIVRVRATRVAELAAEGDWRARSVELIQRRLDTFLSATQLGITLTSLGLGWIGEPAFAHMLEPVFAGLGIASPRAIRNTSAAVAFGALTLLHIVVGELAPKGYAIRFTERVALWSALPMRLFQLVFWPAIWLLGAAARGTLRLLGVAPETSGELAHTEGELRRLLAESQRLGVLSEEKRELLANVMEYTGRAARHVMIPRADIAYLSLARSLEENLAVISRTAHTRFPLGTLDIDHVVGMIHVKDLFLRRDQLRTSEDLLPLKREILFVPETRPLDALQRDFQQHRTHMAIVVDEYGGTAGLVTLEDVIEEIVGDIQDEFDREPPRVEETPEGLLFAGLIPIGDVAERLGVELAAGPEVSTLAGLVTERLGRIPRPGDTVTVPGFVLKVVDMRGRRVTKVLAVARPEARDATVAGARGGG